MKEEVLLLLKSLLRIEENVRYVCLEGELDLDAVEVLNGLALNGCENEKSLILDLAGVHFVDSTGLHCLLQIWRYWQQREKPVQLINIQEGVEEVFRLVGLDELLKTAGRPGDEQAVWKYK